MFYPLLCEVNDSSHVLKFIKESGLPGQGFMWRELLVD